MIYRRNVPFLTKRRSKNDAKNDASDANDLVPIFTCCIGRPRLQCRRCDVATVVSSSQSRIDRFESRFRSQCGFCPTLLCALKASERVEPPSKTILAPSLVRRRQPRSRPSKFLSNFCQSGILLLVRESATAIALPTQRTPWLPHALPERERGAVMREILSHPDSVGGDR